MKRTILFFGLTWTLAAGAEARDWGFDKDTVYEWNPGGDTVWLMNSGTDTLVIDTLLLKIIRPELYRARAYMTIEGSGRVNLEYISLTPPNWEYGKLVLSVHIPPGQAKVAYNFEVNYSGVFPAMMNNEILMGDTIVGQLIFKSLFEKDTIMLVGTAGFSTSIYGDRRIWNHEKFAKKSVDVLGRIQGKSNKTPLLMRIME